MKLPVEHQRLIICVKVGIQNWEMQHEECGDRLYADINYVRAMGLCLLNNVLFLF